MLRDITLGQYFPGNSVLHRIDPRIKILSAILYIIAVFASSSLISVSFVVIVTAILVMLSQIPPKTIIKSIKPVVIILIFTTLYQVLFYNGKNLIVDIGFAEIYVEGIVFGVMLALRIICLLVGSGVILTYTTSPIMLTDGIERLLSPLAKIGLPVHEFAMMMTIALRFIPTLVEETDKIINAQKARGTDFTSGGLIKRAKALIPILIPLFISAFRRATDLATAMECRCYRGGKGRTRMTVLKLDKLDIIAFIISVLILAAVIVMNIYVKSFSIGVLN